jgi:DNA-binding transcriptional LysR family regulator
MKAARICARKILRFAAAILRNELSKVHNQRMFDWNDLKHFLAVARHGSTLAAAKALGLSQSTVHRRIDELEKRLGRQLVVRHPTGYRLTETGKEMVVYAARVEEAAMAFERHLVASDLSLAGTIRITCPVGVGAHLMRSDLIAKFNDRYPNLRVEFILNDALLDLAKGEADVAIRATAPYDDALFGRKIVESPWAIYGSPAYLARCGTVKAVTDIDRHSVALLDIENREHVTKGWLEKVAPNARVTARCHSTTALVSAAKSGVGLVALPIIVADGEEGLVRAFGPVPDLSTNFYLLIHRDMRGTPRVRTFFDFVIENLSVLRSLFVGEIEKDQKSIRSTPKR